MLDFWEKNSCRRIRSKPSTCDVLSREEADSVSISTVSQRSDCWQYGQGGFYVLSSNLVRMLADHESELRDIAPPCGYAIEDLLIGYIAV